LLVKISFTNIRYPPNTLENFYKWFIICCHGVESQCHQRRFCILLVPIKSWTHSPNQNNIWLNFLMLNFWTFGGMNFQGKHMSKSQLWALNKLATLLNSNNNFMVFCPHFNFQKISIIVLNNSLKHVHLLNSKKN
jgi:hypothetical protein